MEVRASIVVQILPSRSQSIAVIRQRSVKIRLWREARCVEPGVPVKVLQERIDFTVFGEECQERRLELVGVQRLSGEGSEIL